MSERLSLGLALIDRALYSFGVKRVGLVGGWRCRRESTEAEEEAAS